MTDEGLCNHPTANGPCNMKKGHPANFHRFRVYPVAASWRIKDPKTKTVVQYGEGRMQLGYAITTWINKLDKLVIEVER